mgnify:FL=1
MKEEEILKLLTKDGPGASAWDNEEANLVRFMASVPLKRNNVTTQWWRYEYGFSGNYKPIIEKLQGLERVESCVNAIDYMNNWDVASDGKVVFILHEWVSYIASNYYFVESQKNLIKKISETEGMHIMMVGNFESPRSEKCLDYVRKMGEDSQVYLLKACLELEEVLDDLKVRYI